MRRVLAVIAALVLLVVAYLGIAALVVSERLLDFVNVEKNLDRPRGDPPASPFALGYPGDPMQAFDYAFETIDIAGELGPLPAWLVPGKSGTVGATWGIHVHGMGGHRQDGYKMMSVLRELDVPTLLISYRNDRDVAHTKEGVYTFGVTEWSDLEAAVELAMSRGANRIVLGGDSMGGAIIGTFLRKSEHAGIVTALVLDAPALDMRAIVDHITEEMGVPLADQIGPLLLKIVSARLGFDLTEEVTVGVISGFGGPLFEVHGTADHLVPVSLSDRLVAGRTDPTLYLRTKADHVLSWQADPDLYRSSLTSFLSGVVQ